MGGSREDGSWQAQVPRFGFMVLYVYCPLAGTNGSTWILFNLGPKCVSRYCCKPTVCQLNMQLQAPAFLAWGLHGPQSAPT